MNGKAWMCWVGVVMWTVCMWAAAEDETTFTYQGRLMEGGEPAQGAVDVEFRLFDSATGGNQVGPLLAVNDLVLDDGLFTVDLDFGEGVFDGEERWVEITVNGTVLDPRQPIRPAPYAHFALDGLQPDSAFEADGDDLHYMQGAVGIGTDSPQDLLDVAGIIGTTGGLRLPDGNLVTNIDELEGPPGQDGEDGEDGASPFGLDGDDAFYTQGNVGLGTDSPDEQLHVNSNIKVSGWIGSDDGPVELHAHGVRGLRIEYDEDSPNVIGGFAGNTVDNAIGATIAGGGEDGGENEATDDFATVGGGLNNTASSQEATVGGGWLNTASGERATVGGGEQNAASGQDATVSGGRNNTASDEHATVGGGDENTASSFRATVGGGAGNTASGERATVGGGRRNTADSFSATVPGGRDNEAGGSYSFAAGRQAKVDENHDGAFVWADSDATNVDSPGEDTFSVQAEGGIWFGDDNDPDIGPGRFIDTSTGGHLTTGGAWENNSDRNAKTALESVDSRTVLAKVADLPITTWRYNNQAEDQRHMGPMAQDFHELFGLGNDATSISTVDTAGVSLAAIQGLHEVVEEQEAEFQHKEQRLQAKQEEIQELEERLMRLEEVVEVLAKNVQGEEG